MSYSFFMPVGFAGILRQLLFQRHFTCVWRKQPLKVFVCSIIHQQFNPVVELSVIASSVKEAWCFCGCQLKHGSNTANSNRQNQRLEAKAIEHLVQVQGQCGLRCVKLFFCVFPIIVCKKISEKTVVFKLVKLVTGCGKQSELHFLVTSITIWDSNINFETSRFSSKYMCNFKNFLLLFYQQKCLSS